MIWRWLICFSATLGVAAGALVSGEVELTNSKNLAVRKHKDYAGVVLVARARGPRRARHAA